MPSQILSSHLKVREWYRGDRFVYSLRYPDEQWFEEWFAFWGKRLGLDDPQLRIADHAEPDSH